MSAMRIYEVYQMPSGHPRYRDLFFMDATEVEQLTDAYEKVCLVDARSLEDVFHICNRQDVEPEFKTLIYHYAPMRSLSVGDIVRDMEANTTYLCAPIGWTILMAGTIGETKMKGITVTRNPQIKLTLTADDWQLYGGEDYPLRDRVARDLNANIQQILNDHDRTVREKKQACWNYLRMYENYGASDTEGIAMLGTIFCEFFGPSYEEEPFYKEA